MTSDGWQLPGGNVWLKQWSEANDDPNPDVAVKKYLGIYVAFGLGSAGLVILQSSTLWLWCSIKVSNYLTFQRYHGCLWGSG
jgi:hypothetical protein